MILARGHTAEARQVRIVPQVAPPDQPLEPDRQGRQSRYARYVPRLDIPVLIRVAAAVVPAVSGLEREGHFQGAGSGPDRIGCATAHRMTSCPSRPAFRHSASMPGGQKVTVTLPSRPSVAAGPVPPRGRFRCPVICRKLVTGPHRVRLPVNTYRKTFPNVQPGC